MKSRVFVAVLLFCLAGLLPAADPQLLTLVMPGAKAAAGINVQQALSTPFGQYLLSQFPANDSKFQELVSQTGFDPRSDIQEILASGTGQPGPQSGVVAARGKFDVTRIVQAVTSMSQGQATIESYNGAQIISGPNRTGCVAFLSDSLALAGSSDNVHAVIDQRSSLDPALAAKVNDLSTTQDAWAVSLVLPQAGAGKMPPSFEPLQHIQQSSGGVKFGANVEVKAEAVADTSDNAKSLADVVRFLLSMAQMSPKAQNPDLTALLQSLTVDTQGNTLKLSLLIAEDQLERLIQIPHGAARIRKANAPAR